MADHTLADQIADQLRRDILRGKLNPGDPIKERDNAAEMGVSRTPMREAIRILAKEGLVILRPARSPVIAAPSAADIRDHLEVLIALEILSGRLACARASSDDIDAIALIHDELVDGYTEMDPLDAFELDMRFHRAIAAAAHNAALIHTHTAYLARMWRARFLAAQTRRNRDRVLGHHGEIVTALRARDADAIAHTIETHLSDLMSAIDS